MLQLLELSDPLFSVFVFGFVVKCVNGCDVWVLLQLQSVKHREHLNVNAIPSQEKVQWHVVFHVAFSGNFNVVHFLLVVAYSS